MFNEIWDQTYYRYENSSYINFIEWEIIAFCNGTMPYQSCHDFIPNCRSGSRMVYQKD